MDHVEMKTGKRQPGTLRGLMSVALTPAITVQTLIFTSLLSASGYDGTVKVQTEEVVQAIRWGAGAVPAAFLVLGIIILRFFPIGKEEEIELQTFTAERHNAPTRPEGETDRVPDDSATVGPTKDGSAADDSATKVVADPVLEKAINIARPLADQERRVDREAADEPGEPVEPAGRDQHADHEETEESTYDTDDPSTDDHL